MIVRKVLISSIIVKVLIYVCMCVYDIIEKCAVDYAYKLYRNDLVDA